MKDNFDLFQEAARQLEDKYFQKKLEQVKTASNAKGRQWLTESSDDEDTAYDQSTRVGRQVEAGPILDRVVSQLPYFSMLSCTPI